MTNQPSQYGYLINFGNGAEVHQIWFAQASGNAWHRGGNGSGWSGSWKLFSPGTANTAQVLSGYTFSSANGSNLSGSMANYSNTIQDITSDATNQSRSCYRINGSNIEVVPAKGYWGNWDWNTSCIRVPLSIGLAGISGSSGIQVYPAANGIKWSGTTSASATGANKSTVTASQTCQTTGKVNVSTATEILVNVSGNCNPTAPGSGSKNAMGSGSAQAWITSDGSTKVKTASVSFDKGQSAKVITLNVSSITGSYFIHVQTTATGGYTSNTKPRYWYSTSTVSLSSVKVVYK